MIKDRLKELRKEKGYTQHDLAQFLETVDSCYASWEQGRTEPNIKAIIALCRFFEVSADYLLGLEDESGAKEYGIPAIPAVSKEERETLELYRKLKLKDRQRINMALEMYADLTEHSKEE